MSMNEPLKDEDLEPVEQLLREFRPVAPRALTIPSRRAPWGVLAVAAAALVVVAAPVMLKRYQQKYRAPVAGTARNAGPRPTVAVSVTMGKLNAAFRTSNRDLDHTLDDTNPHLLPHAHPGTALFELGKE